MDKIDFFLKQLSQIETQPTLTNIYAASSPQSEVCINNLTLHLRTSLYDSHIEKNKIDIK